MSLKEKLFTEFFLVFERALLAPFPVAVNFVRSPAMSVPLSRLQAPPPTDGRAEFFLLCSPEVGRFSNGSACSRGSETASFFHALLEYFLSSPSHPGVCSLYWVYAPTKLVMAARDLAGFLTGVQQYYKPFWISAESGMSSLVNLPHPDRLCGSTPFPPPKTGAVNLPSPPSPLRLPLSVRFCSGFLYALDPPALPPVLDVLLRLFLRPRAPLSPRHSSWPGLRELVFYFLFSFGPKAVMV